LQKIVLGEEDASIHWKAIRRKLPRILSFSRK
jgi:hypothetical protein